MNLRIHPAASLLLFLFLSCDINDTARVPPGTMELKQNAPNPFTDTTLVQYSIPVTGTTQPNIRVAVLNRYNDMIVVLRDSNTHPAGTFNLTWKPGTSHPAGLYYVELQVSDVAEDEYVPVQRIALLKR